MLTEIFSHTKAVPPPADVDSARCTLRYLESCSLIFEKGLLSHERIMTVDSKIIENVQAGFEFFCDWLDEILENGKNQHGNIF